jgi:hypothetical protein
MKQKMAICPKCGFASVLEKEKYCPNCSMKLIKKCPNCDAPIDHPLAQYCPVCGAKYWQEGRQRATRKCNV